MIQLTLKGLRLNVPKEFNKFVGNKNTITNIYKIQGYHSIMRGYFCIGFIDFMLKVKAC